MSNGALNVKGMKYAIWANGYIEKYELTVLVVLNKPRSQPSSKNMLLIGAAVPCMVAIASGVENEVPAEMPTVQRLAGLVNIALAGFASAEGVGCGVGTGVG